jgi:hypothetical protein
MNSSGSTGQRIRLTPEVLAAGEAHASTPAEQPRLGQCSGMTPDALLSSAEGLGLLSGLSCMRCSSGVVSFSYLPDGRGISLLAVGGVWSPKWT